MKKILIIAAFALTSVIASAQSTVVSPMLSPYSLALDTVTNAGTNYVTVNTTSAWTDVTIQPVITKVSGTVAGTYYLQGSIDGTNFKSIVGDSVTATNVTTNTKLWVLSTRSYKYYRVAYTGTGTMVATLRSYLFVQNVNK